MSFYKKKTSSEVEKQVREYYDDFGWGDEEGVKGEDLSFRMFRPAYYPYHEAVEARTMDTLEPFDGNLLVVGCGDMPDSHVDIATRFDQATCIDISQQALDIAAERLPKAHMELGSILDSGIEENSFDAVFCAHVLYHIDAVMQKKAVSEMIRITKPGGKVVVIYSNPRSPLRYMYGVAKLVNTIMAKAMGNLEEHRKTSGQNRPALYFLAHPLGWWSQFGDRCDVSMIPWDVIGSLKERQLVPSDGIARTFYGWSGRFEQRFPSLAVRFWEYPLIVLTKKA